MNWGAKLAASLGVFIVGIVFAGVYMVTQNQDSLVEGDYYEKGLNYDETYQQKQNVILDEMKPILGWKGDSLTVQFKQDQNQGDFIFTRPSDQDLDVEFPFHIPGRSMQLPLATLKKGTWNLSIRWKSQDKAYLFQEVIYIQ